MAIEGAFVLARSYLTFGSALLVHLAALPLAGQAAPPTDSTYQRLRRDGTICYRQRDYRCALEKFEQALAIEPAPEMRFNVASAQDKLGLSVLAVRQYRRYLRETGSQAPMRARAHIARRMKTLLAQVARLQFSLSPASAQISLDGVPLAHAATASTAAEQQTELVLEPGKHRIEISSRGFHVKTFTMTLEAGTLTKRQVQLKPMPRYGRLSIDSSPAGAEIWLDGARLAARTPASLSKVKAGWRSLQLFTADKAYHRNVQVPPDEEVKLTVRLRPVTGRLRITSKPPGATVALDGQPLSSVTPVAVSCAIGEHSISLSKTGFIPSTQRVSIDARRSSRAVDVTLQPGAVLRVKSSPVGATLLVDGRPSGQTPTTITIPPGSHQLEARLGGYHPQQRTLTLGTRTRTQLSLSLRATAGQTRLLAERRRKLLWFYGGGSVAVVSLAAMGILYGVAQHEGNAAHASYESATSDKERDRWAKEVRSAESKMIAGHVLAGVGAAALSIALYHLITRPSLRLSPSRVALEVRF